ncbi:MAG TPA: NAD(P)H-dependent oxidoreductase subunit E [Actinomycetota bacterium]|nr:NAD(P)H-dependent oxidoreductase subunit E [Actinomycetota bacterium]
MAVFEGDVLADARAIMARYPQEHVRSAVMPLLYLAQSVDGMLTAEALREIGALLGITTAEVQAVASFYSMYRLRPTGAHVVGVCTNLACKLRGAEAVYVAARQAAGLAHGEEVSGDGLFTVHEEECLGVCEHAPGVQVDLCNHDDVTPERIRELVGRLRDGEVPEPARGTAFGSFRAASRALAGLEAVPGA